MTPPAEPQSSAAPASSRRPRRRRRWLPPAGEDERQALLAAAARRAVPSAWFFLQMALAALVWSWALLADLPTGLVLGALATPFLGPVVGLGLGLFSGSWAYVGQVLGALGVGGLLAFGIGLLGGLASLAFSPSQASDLLRMIEPGWGAALLLAVGTLWGTWALVRAPQRTALPGVALAYALWLPLTAVGFGLAGGQAALWHNALTAFGLHLLLAVWLSMATAWALGLRPVRRGTFLAGAVLLLLATGGAGWLAWPHAGRARPAARPTPPVEATLAERPLPARTASATVVGTLSAPAITATPTPTSTAVLPPTPTMTPSPTPSPTPTVPTPTPTPIVAIVYTEQANGVIIRQGPGFDQPSVGGALNGTKVIILEIGHEVDGYLWAKVYVPSEDLTGWVVQRLLIVATPAPRW